VRRFATLLALGALTAGCDGSSPPERGASPSASSDAATTTLPPPPTTTAEAAPPPQPLRGLPRYTAGYESWTRLSAERIPPRDSDPHLGTKQVYASRPPRANGVYRYGSIVVKEARRPGKSFVGLVAAMRKVRGADPEHNDWVFVEWTRERRSDAFSETASGAVCTSCHVGAAESDYVWIAELGLTR
jgi:hypothetical protein